MENDFGLRADSTDIRRHQPTVHDAELISALGLSSLEECVWHCCHVIKDPEFPYTLGQLRIINAQDIHEGPISLDISFSPTVPHCSMTGIIGLCVIWKVSSCVMLGGKHLRVSVKDGTHNSSKALNKQLHDKERVLAALENQSMMDVISSCTAFRDYVTSISVLYVILEQPRVFSWTRRAYNEMHCSRSSLMRESVLYVWIRKNRVATTLSLAAARDATLLRTNRAGQTGDSRNAMQPFGFALTEWAL